MPRIQQPSPRPVSVQSTAPKSPARTPSKTAEQEQPVQRGWAPKTSGVRPSSRPQVPDVATGARAFVEAMIVGQKAMSQVDMVKASIQQNNALEGLVKNTGAELAEQLRFRGDEKGAAKVEKDLASFMKGLKAPQPYHLDRERGTMAALEDNGARAEKLQFKLAELANGLAKANKEPAGEYQAAYNAQARGSLVEAEARFVAALGEAYVNGNGDGKVLDGAMKFLKALPRQIDAKIENRGGSLEPLERDGGAASALTKYIQTNLN